jgi:hypothetical protein
MGNLEPDTLLDALRQAREPINASALRKQLGNSTAEKQIEAILETLVQQGKVYACKPVRGRTLLYSTRSPEERGRDLIPRLVEPRPLTRAELRKKLEGKLGDLAEDKKKNLVSALLKEGVLLEWPAKLGGRSKLLSTRPVEPRYYLDDVLEKLGKKLGLSSAQLRNESRTTADESRDPVVAPPVAPPPAVDLPQLIREGMVRVEPAAANGALVSLTVLRRGLRDEIPGKDDFDQAVFRLAADGRVALHQHDFPASLTQTERNELVTDGRGNYFIGIAFRL